MKPTAPPRIAPTRDMNGVHSLRPANARPRPTRMRRTPPMPRASVRVATFRDDEGGPLKVFWCRFSRSHAHPNVTTRSDSTTISRSSFIVDTGQTAEPSMSRVSKHVPHARTCPPRFTKRSNCFGTSNFGSRIRSTSTPEFTRNMRTAWPSSLAVTPNRRAFHATSGAFVPSTIPIFMVGPQSRKGPGVKVLPYRPPSTRAVKVVILDGFVDEPSNFGVPPFLSPSPRYLAGAVRDAGHEWEYVTIERVRAGHPLRGDLLAAISGPIVPGKYLRGMPISEKELLHHAANWGGIKVLGGPLARFRYYDDNLIEAFDFIAIRDLDTAVYDYLTNGDFVNRDRTMEEGDRWGLLGADGS